jgi:hypothetical protein
MNRAILVVAFAGFAIRLVAQERLPLGTHVGSSIERSTPGGSPSSSTYTDGGRRDPFDTLLLPRRPVSPAPRRPIVGLAGVALADVAVKGIVHSGAATLAVLEEAGGKSFVARRQDRLQDAAVKDIDQDGVVFVERVVDAVGAVRTREVRKSLRLASAGDR